MNNIANSHTQDYLLEEMQFFAARVHDRDSFVYKLQIILDQNPLLKIPSLLVDIPSTQNLEKNYSFRIQLGESTHPNIASGSHSHTYEAILRNKNVISLLLQNPSLFHLNLWVNSKEWLIIDLPREPNNLNGTLSLAQVLHGTREWVKIIKNNCKYVWASI